MKKIMGNMMFLFLLSMLSLGSMSCSDDDENFNNDNKKNEISDVRNSKVEQIDGKVVITWIDPYDTNTKEVVVTDLTNNVEKIVAKGVERVEFDVPDVGLLAYPFSITVVAANDKKSDGLTVRLIKNWAEALHDPLPYKSDKTPQSGMFFKNNMPVKTIVFDLRGDEQVARMIAASMQGIINREQGEVYLIWTDLDESLLTDLDAPNVTRVPGIGSRNSGLAALYNEYADHFSKLYLWDPAGDMSKDWTWNMAVMMSAQNDGIPVSKDLLSFFRDNLGCTLPQEDLTEKWASEHDAYKYMLENYPGKFHGKLSFSLGLRSDYLSNAWRLYDYATASKGFVFWLDESSAEDLVIFEDIFNTLQYPVGSSSMGFGMNTIGDDLNKYINTKNVGFVVSDYYSNGSYWCGFPNQAFQQRRGIPVETEPGKIYVAISWSDGDNIQFDAGVMYQIFKEDQQRGGVPVATTMAAGLQELNPKLLEYYYKNMTSNDEFSAGPSGFQFIYGSQYSQSGKYEEWLDMNKKWMETAGFHTVHLWNTSEQRIFKQYMETAGADLVMDGFDNTHTSGAAYKYVDGVVRIDQGTHCKEDGDIYRDLMSISPSERRPLFKHVYILTEYYARKSGRIVGYQKLMDELARVERESPNTYVYLLPMDLAATIKQFIEEGGNY